MTHRSVSGRLRPSQTAESFDAMVKSKAFRRLPETDYHYLSARLFCIEELSVRRAWVVRRHEHNSFEMIACRQGTYSCLVNKQQIDIGRGQAVLIKPGDWHEDVTRRKCDVVFVKFYITGASDTRDRLSIFASEVPASRCVFSCTPRMLDQISDIASVAREKDLLSSLMQDALTLGLFWTVCRQFPSDVFKPEFLSTLAADTIENRLAMLYVKSGGRCVPVPQIARELAMSVSALERMCQQEMKVSPAKAWSTLRMNEAMRIVRHTRMTLKEISEKLAFSHQNHFTNAFTRHFGNPPSYFRTHGYPGLLHEDDRPPVADDRAE